MLLRISRAGAKHETEARRAEWHVHKVRMIQPLLSLPANACPLLHHLLPPPSPYPPLDSLRTTPKVAKAEDEEECQSEGRSDFPKVAHWPFDFRELSKVLSWSVTIRDDFRIRTMPK
jgi:hypothetical protein